MRCTSSNFFKLFPTLLVLVTAICLATSPTAHAQSTPVGGGTLSWTVSALGGPCRNGYATTYTFSGFQFSYTFTSPQGTKITENIPFGGVANYILSPGGQGCPPPGPQPTTGTPLIDSSKFYRILFMPTSTFTGTAAMDPFYIGTIQPSYVVLSVIYAPPGSGTASNQSYVDYTNTTEVGTSSSLSNSFTQSNEYSVSGLALGVSYGLTSTETQQEQASSSLAINKTASVSDKYPGTYPALTLGLNHDNDIVLLWLNASMDCEAEGSWTPYSGFPTLPAQTNCILDDPAGAPGDRDDPLMDVVQLPVGWLNGDYPMDSDVQNIPTNHGITSANYADILGADPYSSCKASISCVQNIGASPTRFNLANAPILDFEPLGITSSPTWIYSSTNTQGQGGTDTHAVGFITSGSENFGGIVTATVKNQETLTWTNTWNAATTSMAGQQAQVSITEPTPSSGYNGPTQFAVYQDNVYGTFMCYPTQ